jgi:hypothetical protein
VKPDNGPLIAENNSGAGAQPLTGLRVVARNERTPIKLASCRPETWVSFTFTPIGIAGKWRIDDFYVDPLKHV